MVPFDWPEKKFSLKFSFKYLVARMPRAERVEVVDKSGSRSNAVDYCKQKKSLEEDNDAGR